MTRPATSSAGLSVTEMFNVTVVEAPLGGGTTGGDTDGGTTGGDTAGGTTTGGDTPGGTAEPTTPVREPVSHRAG